ncbi:hypothetical protein ACQPUY_15250 [Clostridium nigeriense]|uniref:hypothetical protein n=1 Tax=Clostridium nigeriense TaxID=1805470 RepID=UPI003D3534CC
MKCDFSFEHYRNILELIRENGYNSTFYDENVEGKQIIIRHDVDLDLDAALEISKIESELGMKAVYFIWIGSPFYNIFENRYKNIIKEIIDGGHEIGLHYDETSHKCNSKEELIAYIDKESKILKTYFDIDIKTVSFHRPSSYILDSDLNCGKYINTYSNKFFKDFLYLSDSRGQWRNGCICSKLNKDSAEKIQFLTHPIWWKNRTLTNQERLKEFLQYKLNKMSDDISNNITIYDKKNIVLEETDYEN